MRIQEMLAIPTDQFAVTEYICSSAILALSKQLPGVVPNDAVAKSMKKPQLEKLIELVSEVVALEDVVRVSEAALAAKVKAYGTPLGWTDGARGTRTE